MPCKPRLTGGVKGHNIEEISLPGSAALCAESFSSVRLLARPAIGGMGPLPVKFTIDFSALALASQIYVKAVYYIRELMV